MSFIAETDPLNFTKSNESALIFYKLKLGRERPPSNAFLPAVPLYLNNTIEN